MAERLRIEMLGRFRLGRGDTAPLALPSQKSTSLLAYLAYYSHRPQPRDVLIDLLWPAEDLGTSRPRLRVMLHDVRVMLSGYGAPELLVSGRATVHLDPIGFLSDVAEFRAAVRTATDAPPAERARCLERAAGLYGGDLLPDFYDLWVLSEREHLKVLYLETLQQLTAVRENSGDLKGALAAARQAATTEPLREEAHFDVMRLYAALGQPSACLRQYQALERLLREELGETPSAATRALAEELRESARTVVAAHTSRPLARPISRLPTDPPADLDPRLWTDFTPDAGARVPAVRRPGHGPRRCRSLPLAPKRASPSSLPAQFTRFFGREEEIARVAGSLCLPEIRLVTLTGPGGSGKSRLAIAVAARMGGVDPRACPFGLTVFVPLADLVEASRLHDAIAGALAAALGRPRSAAREPLEEAVEALQGQPSLLVLDNFEHLVGEGSLQLRRLLERASSLTCLVTSRQRLGIAGEREFIVLPLPTPRPPSVGHSALDARLSADRTGPRAEQPAPSIELLFRYPSVQLFVDRAQAVRPEFRLTEGNAASVAELCDRLEGLPLALELAAAWAAVLSPTQMLARMEHRFQLLITREHDVPARHRTLLAAVEGSYQGLRPELQRFFRRLSVFRGGWTLEAAEAVCEEPQALDVLMGLCERSLVVAEGRGQEGRPGGEESGEEELRYRLLETLREYGWEQLRASGELSAARDRHQEWYLRLAERAYAAAEGPAQRVWLTRLEAELDNLRAALAWCQAAADADPESDTAEAGLRLASALSWLWSRTGHLAEGLQWLEGALARGGHLPASLRAPAIFRSAYLASTRGEQEKAACLWRATRQEYEKALALGHDKGDRRAIADATLALAELAHLTLDVEGAQRYSEEARQEMAALGDRVGLIRAIRTLDVESAGRYAAEVRQQMEVLGDRVGLNRAIWLMATLALSRGDQQTARPLLQELIPLCRKLGDSELLMHALGAMGHLDRDAGDYARARSWYAESLALRREVGHLHAVAQSLEDFAVLAGREQQAERAIRLLGAAEAFCETLGARPPVVAPAEYERTVAEGRAALGERAFVDVWAKGRRMTTEEACAYALQGGGAPPGVAG